MPLDCRSIIKASHLDSESRITAGRPSRLDEVRSFENVLAGRIITLVEETQLQDFFTKAHRDRVASEPGFVD